MKKKTSLFDKAIKKIDIQELMLAIQNGSGKPLIASYSADCDDGEGLLNVMQTFDGDVHLSISPGKNQLNPAPGFRARTFFGGGRKERVRKALMLLALAIKEDTTDERP